MDPQSIAAFQQTSEEKPPKQVSVSYYWKTAEKHSKEGVDGIISDGLSGLCLTAADL